MEAYLLSMLQVRLVCELEKKFSGQHVVLVAQRKIQDKEKHSNRKASKGQVSLHTVCFLHLVPFTGTQSQ